MIKRPRSLVNEPHILSDVAAVNERAKVKAHYQIHNDPTGEPSYQNFTIYRHSEVKGALLDLFFEKCAYCEAKFENHGVHVEHFRPKAQVEIPGEQTSEPIHGYWWLASEWSNLLPTCIDCNTGQYHELPNGQKVKQGKGNLFPLPHGQSHARKPEQVWFERPLLLNPCIDNPGNYIRFVWMQHPTLQFVSIAQPFIDSENNESIRGRVSIDTYGLNRKRLVDARSRRLKLLMDALTEIEFLLSIFDDSADARIKSDVMTRVANKWGDILATFTAPSQPFSAACYAAIKSWYHQLQETNDTGCPFMIRA